MSSGKLCGDKISIGFEINASNREVVTCDLYEGHDGPHSKMIYHVKNRGKGIIDNFRLGRITWDRTVIDKKDD